MSTDIVHGYRCEEGFICAGCEEEFILSSLGSDPDPKYCPYCGYIPIVKSDY